MKIVYDQCPNCGTKADGDIARRRTFRCHGCGRMLEVVKTVISNPAVADDVMYELWMKAREQ